MQEGTARCATVRDAGSCCSNAEVKEREHLSAAKGASASAGVSSPTGRSVGRYSADAMLGDRTSSNTDAVIDQSDRG